MFDRQLKRYCPSVSGLNLQLQTAVMSSNKESSAHCCAVTFEVAAASSPLVQAIISKALCMFAALSLIQKLILLTRLWASRLLNFSYSSAVSARPLKRLKSKQKSFSSTANECVCSNCHDDRVSNPKTKTETRGFQDQEQDLQKWVSRPKLKSRELRVC